MHAGHDHAHPGIGAVDHRKQLWIVFGITSIIVIAQAVGSVITGSLALLTDTGHALVDSSGLLVALIAATLMLRPADPQRTWGFRRIEVVSALAQSTILLMVGIYAAFEGVRRLFTPPSIQANELLIFGVIGLLANVFSIFVLSSSRESNFNMRAAFLEVVNDALGSLGVIVAALVIRFTGFQRADALAGLFIAALIVPRAFKLMKETTSVLMEFTPPHLNLDEVRQHLLELEHVQDVHDLHASTVVTGLPILSAHIVVSDECFKTGHAAEILQQTKDCVAQHFPVSIQHSTIQIETAEIAAHEARCSRC